MIPVETPDPDVIVVDEALSDAETLRAYALTLPFESHQLGRVTFHGIAMAPPVVGDVIAQADPRRVPTLSFFRKSPHGQSEPHYIHSDRSMGQWTALLYLTESPPSEDGTIFWEHVSSGERWDMSDTLDAYASNGLRWQMNDDWRQWHRVSAKFNRMVIFPAPYYHSRAIAENYGDGDAARLVNVTFGGFV